jgi:hypothetical protein
MLAIRKEVEAEDDGEGDVDLVSCLADDFGVSECRLLETA